MEAHAKTIRQILESGSQFLIPFFQRSYSWRKPNWKRLWTDVASLFEDGHRGQHFLGPLVCTIEKAIPGSPSMYLLIDGQQRLTTLSILLAALRDVATRTNEKKLAARIHESYLVHRHEEGLQKYKILPRIGDREVLIGIVDQNLKKDHEQSPLVTAYRYFSRMLEEHCGSDDVPTKLSRLFAIAADQLALVVITIDGENPFEIFESLNSTGLPLEESDLIRNFLFMQVPLDKQEAFNGQYWKDFEAFFPGSESGKLATSFYRHYLMRNGEYSKAKSTFVDFKTLCNASPMAAELRVKELTTFAEFDRILRNPDLCDSRSIRTVLHDITRLDVTTAYPLILNLFARYALGGLSETEFAGCLTDLASFVLRRSICGESTRAYGRWFVEAIKAIAASPRSDLQQYWFKRGWPDNAAVRNNLGTFPIYRREPKKLRLMLEAIEIAKGHKEKVLFDNVQIEHVMPQSIGNSDDGKSWKSMLGDSWKEVHDSLLHTVGNLTLTAYNPELSNRSYKAKKDELSRSHLELNRHFASVPSWTKDAIEKRTLILAKDVTTVWPRPPGGPAYAPSPDNSGATGNLFQNFWSEFAMVLKAVFPEVVFARCPSPNYGNVKGPRRCFWYMFYANPEDRMISVGIETTGKNRREWLALLWDNLSWEEQEALETECSATCWWHVEFPQMYLCQHEVDVCDKNAWLDQHQWMVTTLSRLCTLFDDRIRELDLANYSPQTLAEIELWEHSDDAESADFRPNVGDVAEMRDEEDDE